MWGKLALFAAVIVSALFVTASITRADECPATPNLPSSDGSQPANLGILKLQLLDYKCFGAYDRDVAKVLSETKAYLEYRANGVGKLALVLDIDETSVSNLPNLLANDFGFFRGGDCPLVPGEPCGYAGLAQVAEAGPARRDVFRLWVTLRGKQSWPGAALTLCQSVAGNVSS